MAFRRIPSVILFVCFNVALFSTDAELFYQQVRSRFDQVVTLKADVAQTNEFIQSKTKLHSTGKLYYKPGNLILDYTQPNIQKLIIKGNSVQIYDKNSKTLIKTSNRQGISNPMQIVDKYWSTSRKEIVSEDSISIHFRLQPQTDENISKLEVVFNKSSTMVTQIAYWDQQGNKVKYRFLNIRTGVVIPSSKWSFVPPHGVKVILR
jgi:outer membrane lipoprotein-sorting protein